ncbi:MAG: type II secretion system F family protein [Methanobacteriota archaeon]
MSLNKYQQFCYRRLGRYAEKKQREKLQKSLAAAHMNIRASAYVSYAILTSLFVFMVTFLVFLFLIVLFTFVLNIQLDMFLMLLFLLLPVLSGLGTYGGMLSSPGSKAKGRGKKIDSVLPYATNFIAVMSSAGVTPTEIFKSLSKQDIYGEVKEEASWIYRDIGMLGSDVITAIKTNIVRTPSLKFKEFLQGLVVTVTSGGSLKTYFMSKADQYMRENRQMQKQLLETLGIMAESYVTAAVAGILMLLIVIPLMMMISNSFDANFLYVLVFGLVPIVHFGFAGIIKLMIQGG